VLNERYDFSGEARTGGTSPPRVVAPKQAKPVTMPAQHRVRLNQQQGITPAFRDGCQPYHPYSVSGGEYGPLDLSPYDDQLLTQQRILQNQVALRAEEVLRDAARKHGGWTNPFLEDSFGCAPDSRDPGGKIAKRTAPWSESWARSSGMNTTGVAPEIPQQLRGGGVG
jgi:hypothetical protein